jgi:hypothetical protein
MDRILKVVPVLLVPVIARGLVDQGPLPEVALKAAFADTIKRLEHGHIYVLRGDVAFAAEVGFAILLSGNLLCLARRDMPSPKREKRLCPTMPPVWNI